MPRGSKVTGQANASSPAALLRSAQDGTEFLCPTNSLCQSFRVRKLVITGATALLAVAFASVVLVPLAYPERRAVTASIENTIPTDMPGWSVYTLPIAETESLRLHVNKVLRYDEAVYRDFRRGNVHVGIYAAYWAPGKVGVSEAGAHTPDTCWIVAGWHRAARAHKVVLAADHRTLLPAEIGTFEKDGTTEHVVFWHLLGGQPVSFDQYGWDQAWAAKFKRGVSWVTDLWRFGFAQRRDQCFVRVTTNVPVREALRDRDIQALLVRCAPLGIFDDPPKH
jgi:hypothetical protein